MENPRTLVEALTGSLAGPAVSSPASPVKALVWARVSTDAQEERGLSIPEQLREIRSYAGQYGIEIIAEYQEAASAFQKDSRRIKFHEMIARAKADPEVSVILVHDMSRFSRDSGRAKLLLGELRQAGVRVISLNDPEVDPDTATGVFMEAITLAKNEAYSREVAFHTRKGCRSNIQTRDSETGFCYKNGGLPLWGYRAERIERGLDKRGKLAVKCIWALDDTVFAGEPIYELVRHCLVEMAAKGASLDQLRDFCNQRGIPARRNKYWATSTWNSILEPHRLLQYCGYGVWNVHRKNGKKRPSSEWVIVENAHPALLSEEEALAIANARGRQRQRTRKFDPGCGRSKSSPYLLSGGLFKCGRCSSNMTGFRTDSGRYYVCGSGPYRRGMGCGPGVYVPKDLVEAEVADGLKDLLKVCSDPKGFVRRVNRELIDLWREFSDQDPEAANKISEIDSKIANIRRAVESGLQDADWANARLRELKAEKEELSELSDKPAKPPQIDAQTAMAYRSQVGKLLSQGKLADRKQLLRSWVEGIKLDPEGLQIEVSYRVAESVMNSEIAGAGFEPATSGL